MMNFILIWLIGSIPLGIVVGKILRHSTSDQPLN